MGIELPICGNSAERQWYGEETVVNGIGEYGKGPNEDTVAREARVGQSRYGLLRATLQGKKDG